MKDVKGKTTLITGAAAGMGKIWARRFAEDGSNLVLWDIDEEGLNQVAEELRTRGVDVMTQRVDVTDREAIYKAALKVQAETGGVDVLLNNAGVVAGGPLLEVPDEKINLTIDVDFRALFFTMKAFLPRMIERQSGHIINISSASGLVGVPHLATYAACKWGVIGLTESVRLELELEKKHGIKFTLVCPSFVDTGMFEGAKPMFLTKMLTPEEIVDSAYKAFKRDQYWVVEPWLIKLGPPLKGILPQKLFDKINDLLGSTTSMTQWKGHGR